MANERYLGESKYSAEGKKNFSKPNVYGNKDELFFKRFAEYIWSQYIRNQSSINYGGYSSITGRSFVELRLYALGQQDKVQYLELLDDYDPLTQEGYLNINLDIVQIIPK
nr:hypothetical protein [Bacteroidota bacterium]